MKQKRLPKNKSEGMYIYCSKCKSILSWTHYYKKERNQPRSKLENKCGLTKKNLSNCKFKHKQKYQARFHLPGSNNLKAIKTLSASNYFDAVQESISFKAQIVSENNIIYTSPSIEFPPRTSIVNYLKECQMDYLDFLANINVPDHQKVKRSEKHIREIQKSMVLFNEALDFNNANSKYIPIENINDVHVGFFHTYLLKTMGYSNKTYNNKMSLNRTFFKWALGEYKLKNNPFDKVKNRSVIKNVNIIEKDEFQKLLEIIKPENGYLQYGGVKKERKNMYRDYLVNGIKLCLHTGGRREEVTKLKWNMIKEIDNEPIYIVINNFKVERQKGEGFNDNVAPKIIPITKDLYTLLEEMEYKNNKNSDKYILCPDRSNVSNKVIMENLSKGFTFFYSQLKTGKNLKLNNLRKTYLTYLNAAVGGDTKSLSSHTTDHILARHYIDKKVVNKAVKSMRIFE